jgi:hypothetical protein
MALAFNSAKGSAKKGSIDQYQYKMGDNSVRMVGGLLPRYIYWVKGFNDKNIPFECLSFNRETETFDNKEKDWVKHYFPDLKCGWAYSILCIDPTDGKVKVLNLKKKLMEQIMVAAEDLGDPTDPETGYSIHFKRVKTGPMNYNIEYQLQPLKCKPTPLTDEEKALVEESAPIDELIPRPSADYQKESLERIINKASEGSDEADEEVEDEFDIDD